MSGDAHPRDTDLWKHIERESNQPESLSAELSSRGMAALLSYIVKLEKRVTELEKASAP